MEQVNTKKYLFFCVFRNIFQAIMLSINNITTYADLEELQYILWIVPTVTIIS
jgi:hypothetical protein